MQQPSASPLPNKPLFLLPLRVYIEDTDAGGIVYHANYLNFMERARSTWLEQIPDIFDALTHQGLMFVVSGATLHFKRPALLRDHLQVSVERYDLRPASLVLAQCVYRMSGTSIEAVPLCTASISLALVNNHSLKPQRLPADLVASLPSLD